MNEFSFIDTTTQTSGKRTARQDWKGGGGRGDGGRQTKVTDTCFYHCPESASTVLALRQPISVPPLKTTTGVRVAVILFLILP